MTSLTKKLHPPTKKFFFECKLVWEDLLCLLSLWTALCDFWRLRYACAKPCVFRLFWCENPQKQPDAKVLKEASLFFTLFQVWSPDLEIKKICESCKILLETISQYHRSLVKQIYLFFIPLFIQCKSQGILCFNIHMKKAIYAKWYALHKLKKCNPLDQKKIIITKNSCRLKKNSRAWEDQILQLKLQWHQYFDISHQMFSQHYMKEDWWLIFYVNLLNSFVFVYFW